MKFIIQAKRHIVRLGEKLFWRVLIISVIAYMGTVGKVIVKFMVMAQKFRKSREDAYYDSALWKYQKEFAVKYRNHKAFVCQDDKLTVKLGEPEVPVAAVEHSKQVLVSCYVPLELS